MQILPQKVHIWRFRVLNRETLQLSDAYASENINNHGHFTSNSV